MNTKRPLTTTANLMEAGALMGKSDPTRHCEIPGCERPYRSRGWCATHYARWSKHGDPNLGAKRPANTTCEAPGCDALAPRNKYCSTHRFRLRRNGSLDLLPRSDRHEHSMGYLIIKRPGHPAATDPRGWLYEHRAVLFDAIGPGWHPCHHCGMAVSWELAYPQHVDALVVDHLDEDKANNDLSNLVPSCATCNFARSNRWAKQHRRESAQ